MSTAHSSCQGAATTVSDAVLNVNGRVVQEPGAGAQPGACESSSFAFSRAGLALTPGVHSSAAEAEAAQNAHVHPLGFFAAEGARQLCQVEGGSPRLPASCSQPYLPALLSTAWLIWSTMQW